MRKENQKSLRKRLLFYLHFLNLYHLFWTATFFKKLIAQFINPGIIFKTKCRISFINPDDYFFLQILYHSIQNRLLIKMKCSEEFLKISLHDITCFLPFIVQCFQFKSYKRCEIKLNGYIRIHPLQILRRIKQYLFESIHSFVK